MNQSRQEVLKNRKDLATKNYFKHDIPFADLFNVFLYQGEQILKPESLTPLDITEITEKEENLRERRRDLVKLLADKSDEKQTYVILGLECQSKSDWRIAIRMMVVDAMRYDEQLQKKMTRKEMNPVISAVIRDGRERKASKKFFQKQIQG